MSSSVSLVLFKQKTAYEVRISDWSSDVCSSDLGDRRRAGRRIAVHAPLRLRQFRPRCPARSRHRRAPADDLSARLSARRRRRGAGVEIAARSEEHTYELQYLMRHSYAVFCLNKQIYNIYYICNKYLPERYI